MTYKIVKTSHTGQSILESIEQRANGMGPEVSILMPTVVAQEIAVAVNSFPLFKAEVERLRAQLEELYEDAAGADSRGLTSQKPLIH